MSNIFPIDFEEKLTMAQDDYILFSDSEDGNKIKKAQYKNLKGEPGTPGTPGQDGADGAAATITVGSTTTGTPGSSASVTNSGTSSAAVLDFTIPQGAKGETGAGATVAIGTTTTLPAGSSATVTNSGTSTNAVLNFGIPKGDSGSGSGDVNGPASSTDGDVAIFDGTTGKLIKDGSVALSTLSSAASLASSAIQPGDDISDLNNDSGFITGITSGDVTTALGYTPYNSTNPAGYTTNTGDVVGPASSTDGHLALFDGVTGKLIKDGGSVPTGVPSGGTDGQVLSKVSGNIEWANASGGDVKVSSQAHNLLTTGMKIWCGEQSDYESLGTRDSNTLYLTVPGAATPGWTPGANTIGYYAMNNNILNHATTGSTFPDGVLNTATFSTTQVHGNNTYSLYCDGSTYAYLPASSEFEFGTNDFTISCWVYSETDSGNYTGIISNYTETRGDSDATRTNHGWRMADRFGNVNKANFCTLENGTGWLNIESSVSLYGGWHNMVVTRVNGVYTIYVDGTQVASDSSWTTVSLGRNNNIVFGANFADAKYSKVYLNDVIFENVGWSAQDVSDYYTLTNV